VTKQKHQNHKSNMLTLGMLAATFSGLLALSGCEKEGPAEKAGKEIDKALSSADSQIQAIGKDIESAVK